MPKKKQVLAGNKSFFIVLAAAFAIISYFTFVYLTKTNQIAQPSPTPSATTNDKYLPTKNSDNEVGVVVTGSRSGWKKYINRQANFSLEYPERLFIIEEHDFRTNGAPDQGRVIFCANQVDRSMNLCDDGFQILYGVPMSDGWGGGCDPVDQKSLVFLGKSQQVCMNANYISQLYATHPQNKSEVSISAHSPSFTTMEEAREMLDSFSFIDVK